MPDYSAHLNEDELRYLIERVNRYLKRVKKAPEQIVRQLTEQGVSLAKQNASYMDIYDSGELVNGIDSRYVGGFKVKAAKGYVESTAPHSAFCEFGTGVVGASSPHPNPNLIPGWHYDVNEHGEEGWWYYDDDGNRMWTKGMPSRPYMYDTARMLRNQIEPTVREVLKK